jgi:hypothetical protein
MRRQGSDASLREQGHRCSVDARISNAGRITMRSRLSAVAIAVSAALACAAPAGGAPENKNSVQLTFICNGEPLTVVTITHNRAAAGQVVSGADGRVFVITKVISDGAVLFSVPGWEDRADVTCTDPEDPGVTGFGFFAPRP